MAQLTHCSLQVVVVAVDGLTAQVYAEHKTRMPCLQRICELQSKCPVPVSIPNSIFSRYSALSGLVHTADRRMKGARRHAQDRRAALTAERQAPRTRRSRS